MTGEAPPVGDAAVKADEADDVEVLAASMAVGEVAMAAGPDWPVSCLRSRARRLENHTWTRASVNLVLFEWTDGRRLVRALAGQRNSSTYFWASSSLV